VKSFIKDFTELDIELLLLILSHCGHALRSDDPSAMKEIVLSVQRRNAENKTNTNSSRVEYMISAMIDLKNNKRRKQDLVFGEKTAKLRKLIGRIKSTAASTGSSKSSDSCLRITLDDILNVQTKGRWWKVGASWIGNQTLQDGADQGEAGTKGGKPRDDEEEELLALASKYRMNTDSRRSIFCIIMGSADCEDAFEKLVRGGMLKNRTERDTVRVLMECCGNEKAYNPFYAHLGARMCEYMPQCKFTFQLAYWDSFKQFNTMKQRKVANLAKLLYQLVAVNPCLKINILKSIDMAPDTIEENAVIFLTIFFSSILGSVEDPNQVFQLIERGIPKADEGGLRESLSVFFLETLKSSPKNKKKSKFRANFKAAVKACEVDEFDGMIPA